MIDLRLGGRVGYLLLRAFSIPPSREEASITKEESGAAKLEADLGKDVWGYIKDQVVLDFGCGIGQEAMAAALHGAKRVFGLEIRDDFVDAARHEATIKHLADRCVFIHASRQPEDVEALYGTVDTVISLDAFEHFIDPARILDQIRRLLRPGGRLLVNFGPPWNHPYGAHARYMTKIPWVHLIFTEKTILKLRGLYRNDGAIRLEDIPGGLNRMTVARFLLLAANRGFKAELLRLRAVGGIQWLVDLPGLREFFTSAVECVLVNKSAEAASAYILQPREEQSDWHALRQHGEA